MFGCSDIGIVPYFSFAVYFFFEGFLERGSAGSQGAR
jgi:hypothetical protein